MSATATRCRGPGAPLHRLLPLLALLASSEAAGQGPPTRGGVFASAGITRVGGDEGSLGTGPCVLLGAGWDIATRASLELDVMAARHGRDLAGGTLDGTATGLFGSVVYRVSGGRAQVFLMGSAGLLRLETTQTYPVGGAPATARARDDGFAWGGGGGVRIFLSPRLSIRPQFRLVFGAATGILGLATGSVGVGYHW